MQSSHWSKNHGATILAALALVAILGATSVIIQYLGQGVTIATVGQPASMVASVYIVPTTQPQTQGVSTSQPASSATASPIPTPKFVPLANYSNSPQISNIFTSNCSAATSNCLANYINVIFQTLISLGAIAAVLRIMWAGYLYMGSADMWGSKQKAKEILWGAIIGLLLLLSIFLILSQINPNLVSLNVLNDFKSTPTANNNPMTNTQLQQAITQVKQQNQTDQTIPQTNYIFQLNPTPLPGTYCFPIQLGNGSGYSCVTDSTNCNTVAQKAGQTCKQY